MEGSTKLPAGEPDAASDLRDEVVEALQSVYDPEIPVHIYDVGLVYGIEIDQAGNVVVRMTLTSPMCPMAMSIPVDVESRVLALPGVTSVRVDLVWEPRWTPDRMSESARLKLGFF